MKHNRLFLTLNLTLAHAEYHIQTISLRVISFKKGIFTIYTLLDERYLLIFMIL